LLKQQAADQVLVYIESGMVVGLGHGSTAILAVRGLVEKLDRGELTDIRGILCSRASRQDRICPRSADGASVTGGRLNPETVPAHILVIRRKVRTEHDFDHYL
jgi:hypothetical protein